MKVLNNVLVWYIWPRLACYESVGFWPINVITVKMTHAPGL